jgi:hypothetical protein
MNIKEAKQSLDKIIEKARVHLYKPIQIAEILYQHRTKNELDLLDLESYRTPSRKWRDVICFQFFVLNQLYSPLGVGGFNNFQNEKIFLCFILIR